MLLNLNESNHAGVNGVGSNEHAVTNGKFMRGEKSSSSVRLRTKKSESSGGGGKKRNRHSGDFSFFSSSKATPDTSSPTASAPAQASSSTSPTRASGAEVKKGGDWAYITFPNGVPTVQDIKTNVGPVSQREAVLPLRPSPAAAAMLMPGSRASVHLSQGMLHHPNQMSNNESGGGHRRVSTDTSSAAPFVSLDHHMGGDMRQRQHAQNGVILRHRQQQQQPGHYRSSCYVEHTQYQQQQLQLQQQQHHQFQQQQFQQQQQQQQQSPSTRHVTQVTLTSSPSASNNASPSVKRPLSTTAANVIFRRKPPATTAQPAASSQGGVAKRCSGEFDFVRHSGRRSSLMLLDAPEFSSSDVVRVQVRDGSYPSPDLVVNRAPNPGPRVERQPGLGRRAVTQINIRQSKKNSYNAALCLSQENLVKATGMTHTDDDDLDDSDLGQISADHSLEKRSTATIKKGLLWQQRDKFFSQWKERYFILTSDYLQCFKKGTSRITEMGEFIYKIKLSELEDVELMDRRGYLVLCFSLAKEGKVYLRKTEGIRDWFNSMKECVEDCKKRRDDRSSKGFWSTKQLTDSSNIEKWLQARKKIGLQYSYLNGESKVKGEETAPEGAAKSARSEITLDELSDLYRCEEEEQQQLKAEHRKSFSPNSISSTALSNPPSQVVQLRVTGSRDDLSVRQHNNNNISRQTKKINRLSLMSDLELPHLGHDLIGSIDLDKGIYHLGDNGRQRSVGVASRSSNHINNNNNSLGRDNESNDSGNNSMNTNGSVASSNSTHSNNSNPREPRERLETHLESDLPDEPDEDTKKIDARDEARLKAGVRRRSREEIGRKYFGGTRRPASHVMPNGLQVTHV